MLNRDIVTFRATLPGALPSQRVERARQRLRELPESAIDQPLRTVPFTFENTRGVQLMLGDFNLFVLVEADLDPESGQSLDALTRQVMQRLEGARDAWHASHDRTLLLLGLAKAAAGTLALGVLVWALSRSTRRGHQWIEAVRDRMAARRGRVDWREFAARLATGTMRLVHWLMLLLVFFLWLRWVLASFVATQPLATALGGWLWGRLAWVAEGAIGGLPGIVTVAIVILLTRAIVDVLGYFFDAVQQGRLQLPFMHPETTTATRRIVALLAWGLGIAVAYPYLPGSDSDAFKGLSVLFGVMLSLGSSGLVTQLMSGLVVIYSRALRRGDYVEVNGVEGVVTEVAALATKVVTVRNEMVTIPNALLVSSSIHNYSRLPEALLTARVTIGYDAPWRQVHAMLIDAARSTPGVRKDFEPYVYQRALSDFFVEYELFAGIDHGAWRPQVSSALHAAIQDAFNAHGVQIMSPHFMAQPDHTVVVPRSEWYKPPAHPPA